MKLPKNRILLFILLFISVNNLQAQFNIFDDDVNLEIQSNTLNKIITITSLGGNYAEVNALLSKSDNNSDNYILGKSILFYNTKGKKEAINFINSNKKLSKERKKFIKAYVSLITNNIDDYEYYNSFLNSSFLKLLLKVKRKYIETKNIIKEEKIVKEISDFLKTEDVSNSYKLYLELMKMYFNGTLNSEDKLEEIVNVLWKKYPHDFEKKNLLKYIEDCKTKECISVREEIEAKKGFKKNNISLVVDKIGELDEDSSFSETQKLEKELKNIIDFETNNLLKEKLKSVINLSVSGDIISNNLQQYEMLFLDVNEVVFSKSFQEIIKTSLSKKEIIDLIINKSPIKDKESIKTGLIKLPKNEVYVILGLQTVSNNLVSELKKSELSKSLKLKISSPPYKSLKNWNTFSQFLTNNPLYHAMDSRFISIPEIKNENDYKIAIKHLEKIVQKFPNNYSLRELKMWVSFSYDDYYVLNNNYANLFFNDLIDLFYLNQSEGHPGIYEKKSLISYCHSDKIISQMDNIINIKNEDDKLLYLLFSKLNDNDIKLILKRIENKLSITPNNKNLKVLYLKILKKIKRYDDYFKNYLKYSEKTNLEHNLDKKVFNHIKTLDTKKVISKLKKAFINTSEKKNLLKLIDLYNEYNLVEESIPLMALQIKRIVYRPYIKEYAYEINNVLNEVKTNSEILNYYKIIHSENPNLDIINFFVVYYELLVGNNSGAKNMLNTLLKNKENLKFVISEEDLLDLFYLENPDNNINISNIKMFKSKIKEIYSN